MENKVLLSFDKTLSALAGNPFGRHVYEEQVKGHVNERSTIYIEFPDQIVKIASSFVQGFFAEWLSKFGAVKTKEKVIVLTKNENLKRQVYSKLI